MSGGTDILTGVVQRLPQVGTAMRSQASHSPAAGGVARELFEVGGDVLPTHVDSKMLWTRIGADGVQQYLPQRRELHQAIVDSILAASKAQPTDTPTATFMMGAPGSGKSKLIEQLRDEGSDAVLLETDAVKDGMPEYRSMVQRNLPHASDFVQQEARDIADLLRDTAMSRRYDVIVDRSGGSSRYVDAVRQAKDRGYRTQVMGAFTDDVEILVERAHDRFLRTGRQVQPKVIREQYPMVSRNAGRFLEDRQTVDAIRLFDNTPDNAKPTLIAERQAEGAVVAHQPSRLRRILYGAATATGVAIVAGGVADGDRSRHLLDRPQDRAA